MAITPIFIFCIQACLFQIAFSQYAGYGPPLGIGPGPGQIGVGPSPYGPLGGSISSLGGPIGPNSYGLPSGGSIGPGFAGPAYGPVSSYGGSGSGDVAVAGELPVAGSTVVAGHVPVIGGVQFGGSIPATGIVTISGSCSCNSPYGY